MGASCERRYVRNTQLYTVAGVTNTSTYTATDLAAKDASTGVLSEISSTSVLGHSLKHKMCMASRPIDQAITKSGDQIKKCQVSHKPQVSNHSCSSPLSSANLDAQMSTKLQAIGNLMPGKGRVRKESLDDGNKRKGHYKNRFRPYVQQHPSRRDAAYYPQKPVSSTYAKQVSRFARLSSTLGQMVRDKTLGSSGSLSGTLSIGQIVAQLHGNIQAFDAITASHRDQLKNLNMDLEKLVGCSHTTVRYQNSQGLVIVSADHKASVNARRPVSSFEEMKPVDLIPQVHVEIHARGVQIDGFRTEWSKLLQDNTYVSELNLDRRSYLCANKTSVTHSVLPSGM